VPFLLKEGKKKHPERKEQKEDGKRKKEKKNPSKADIGSVVQYRPTTLFFFLVVVFKDGRTGARGLRG
jgi:hypothetical protein